MKKKWLTAFVVLVIISILFVADSFVSGLNELTSNPDSDHPIWQYKAALTQDMIEASQVSMKDYILSGVVAKISEKNNPTIIWVDKEKWARLNEGAKREIAYNCLNCLVAKGDSTNGFITVHNIGESKMIARLQIDYGFEILE